MTKKDIKLWEEFRSTNGQTLTPQEFELICELHAKYFAHSFYKPCTCSPKTIVKWIHQLNQLYGSKND